ncbi:MAG TPA: STAS/SEC14 domain-containing protein [Polyangiales bacterium]|nr:STAS/SEC14 domain-containing protein [Polyangiales bacterium]
MLDILQAPNHVAAFRLSGDVTKADYDRIVVETEAKLQSNPRIAVYTELVEPMHMTLAALYTDLRYALSKVGQWRRFARVALVTDKAWASSLMRLFGPWLPDIEARSFHSAERDHALAWAGQPQPRPPALRMIATSRPDTYAMVWNGRIKPEDIEQVLGVLRTEFEAHMSVRVLVRIEDMGGIEPAALLKPGLLRVKLLGRRKIERYAIVGGPSWLERYLGFAKRISNVEVRYFPLAQEADAWAWLEAQPSGTAKSAAGQAEAVNRSTLRYD